ncbi:uncharacterized protein LOC132719324 isoform X2 [Ruditapes philippinarum]|uniref:uncharacterized protein LOC132719324 isoform X2 n=1 Tax=Ruditapes philippinarum TaxID=129788 RepID=UPI00295B35E5|nr:uncharacterized protein LOC132719324 isoform X2 [Ruditapes philippinarum]
MSSSSDNTLRFLLYLFLISILFTFISSAEKSKCLPTEGKKWNYKKQKCVECPECGPGSFRNLSEQYKGREGEHGAERCIKCRPCPKGTYSSSGYGECSRCRLNCAEFHREVSEPCSSQHDAICGSCLTGYFDMYKNTLFPCAPNSERVSNMQKEPRLLPPRKKEDDKVPDKKVEVQDTNHVDRDNEVDKDTDIGQSDEFSAIEGETEPTSTIYVVIGAFVFAVCVVGLLAGFLLKRRGISRPRSGILSTSPPVFNVSGHAPSRYSRVPRQDLSHDNDIEMDTLAHTGQSDASLYLQSEETHFQMTPVRAELPLPIDQQVRPELSQQCPTNHLDALGHAPSYYSRVPRT